MIKSFIARLKQGHQTGKFPHKDPVMPDRFLGLPELSEGACPETCSACMDVCPTNAISHDADGLRLDMGRCLFCGKCQSCCAEKRISFTSQHDLGTFTREGLVRTAKSGYSYDIQPDKAISKLVGRSLKLRHVSAGGCAACELDFNALNTLAWDLARFNIEVVASPRHADAVLVTGPVTKNMLLALKKTYEAIPKPSFVIACGTCAISGGLYADSDQTCGGLEEVLKPDLYIPGCPPHPATLLDALVRFMGKKPR